MSDTKPITPEDLQRLDALEKNAGRAPWVFYPEENRIDYVYVREGWRYRIITKEFGVEHPEDGAFICALRNAYPALRARIAELEKELLTVLVRKTFLGGDLERAK